jgi:hypothetical protein
LHIIRGIRDATERNGLHAVCVVERLLYLLPSALRILPLVWRPSSHQTESVGISRVAQSEA